MSKEIMFLFQYSCFHQPLTGQFEWTDTNGRVLNLVEDESTCACAVNKECANEPSLDTCKSTAFFFTCSSTDWIPMDGHFKVNTVWQPFGQPLVAKLYLRYA